MHQFTFYISKSLTSTVCTALITFLSFYKACQCYPSSHPSILIWITILNISSPSIGTFSTHRYSFIYLLSISRWSGQCNWNLVGSSLDFRAIMATVTGVIGGVLKFIYVSFLVCSFILIYVLTVVFILCCIYISKDPYIFSCIYFVLLIENCGRVGTCYYAMVPIDINNVD